MALGWDSAEAACDLTIFLAYTGIPLQLYVMLSGAALPASIKSIRLCFVAFILSCGLSHLTMAAPYGGDAVRIMVKALCAAISTFTVLVLHNSFVEVRTLIRQSCELEESVQRHLRQLTYLQRQSLHYLEQNKRSGSLERTRTNFMSMVSHEMRTPLNAILGSTDVLLESDRLDAEDRACAKVIRGGCLLMLSTINDLLDTSVYDDDSFRLSHAPLLLRNVFEVVRNNVRTEAEKKSQSWLFEFANGLPKNAVGDEPRLMQAVSNVALNAVKFMPSGGHGSLTFSLETARWVADLAHEPGVTAAPAQGPRRNQSAPITVSDAPPFALAVAVSAAMAAPSVPASTGKQNSSACCGPQSDAVDVLGHAHRPCSASGGAPLYPPSCKSSLAEASHFLVVKVSDTGIGITHETIPQIFTRFFQADNNISRTAGGSGLGLAISNRLVQLMHGHLLVQSDPGSGTNMWLCFPLFGFVPTKSLPSEPAPHMLARKHVAPVPKALPSGVDPRILIVEDNSTNQIVLRRVLAKLGHRSITTAAHGLEGVNACRTDQFDIIFMDIHMPVMDGKEATRLIRREHGSQPFIIALTADSLEGLRELSFDALIQKPFQLVQLKESICAWFATRHSKRSPSPADESEPLFNPLTLDLEC